MASVPAVKMVYRIPFCVHFFLGNSDRYLNNNDRTGYMPPRMVAKQIHGRRGAFWEHSKPILPLNILLNIVLIKELLQKYFVWTTLSYIPVHLQCTLSYIRDIYVNPP